MNTHFGTLTITRPFVDGIEIINFQDVLAEVGLTGEVLDGGNGTTVNPWETSVFPNTTHPILFKNDGGTHGVNIKVNQRIMTRQETLDYHRAELARLEQEGSTDEFLMEYHREGAQIFLDPPPFNPEAAARLAQVIAKMSGKPAQSLEEMERKHNEFYANEKLLQ